MKITNNHDRRVNRRIYIRGCRTVKEKIENVYSLVQNILDTDISSDDLEVVILKDVKEVDAEFKRIYGMAPGYIAFYSHRENKIFLSAKDIKKRVIAHEFAHYIARESIEQYGNLSVNAHELIAQGVERFF